MGVLKLFKAREITFIIFIFGAFSYGVEVWVPFPGGLGEGPPTFNVLASDNNHTVVEVTTPGMWTEDVDEGGITYHRLNVPEYEDYSAGEEGRPEVPGVAEFVAVPGSKNVSYNILETQQTILDDYWIYPVQPDCFPGEEEPSFLIDEGFYAEYEGFYLADGLAISEPAIWRDLRVVSFEFRPISFNPATRQIQVTQYIKFELVYEGESDVNVKEDPDYPIEKGYGDMYRASVLNYDDLNLVETGWDLDGPGKYLIITDPRYETLLRPLVDWLTERGFSVIVMKTVDILGWGGGNKPAAIHQLIRSLYLNYRTKYVLLVGQHTELPTLVMPSYDNPDPDIGADHYYSCVSGSDVIPDVAVGRIQDLSEHLLWFDDKINKITIYGKSPPVGDWPGNVLLVANKEKKDDRKKDSQICKENIRTYSGYDHFQPSFYCAYGRELGVNNETVTSFINSGAGVVNYCGHGLLPIYPSQPGWGAWADWCGGHSNNYFWPTQIDIIPTRNDKYPIVFNSCCYGGKFEGNCPELYCHCEGWLNGGFSHERPYYGAVAAYGNTRPSAMIRGNYQDKQFFKAIYKWGTKTVGDVINHAKCDLIKQYGLTKRSGFDKYAMDLLFMGMLMGEPSTGVKTKPILTFNVSHPASLPSGSTICEVSVAEASSLEPVAEALVCMYRDGVLHVAQMTGEDGVTAFEIDDTGAPGADTIKLTVYERNYVTYQDDLDVE